MVKICPICRKCNAETVSWCLGCATVLVGVETQPLPRRHPKPAVDESFESHGGETVESFEDSCTEAASNDKDTTSTASVNGASMSEGTLVEKLFNEWEGNEIESDEDDESKKSITAMETPNSVFDEEVTPLTSPMIPMSPPSSAGVWDPRKVDVAALIHQSRALVNKSPAPTGNREGTSMLKIKDDVEY